MADASAWQRSHLVPCAVPKTSVYVQGTGTRTHTRTPARTCTRLVHMYVHAHMLHAALAPSASLYTGHAAWGSCHFSIVDIHELEQLIPKKRSVMAKRSEGE